MRERELRLALVCYGGVSLAIYMHGVAKEIWKLLRASRAFHDRDPARLTDSERVYLDLLTELSSRKLALTVVVDILAGSSAGGINAVFLGHAIASGQDFSRLTDLWLRAADLDELLDPKAAPASRWSKVYAEPLAWMAGRRYQDLLDRVDPHTRDEVKTKLSRLVRSRWFEPPFDGPGFTRKLLTAFKAMADAPAGPPLAPPGLPLDLFVTVTDLPGHPEILRLNSPPQVVETEHRLVIGFHDSGQDKLRTLGDVPSLVLAARATASLPGAFPPFRLPELDAALREFEMPWDGRERFLARHFPTLAAQGRDASSICLIDGGVLDNAPFGPAISALRHRPANREVDRRFLFIDPTPGKSVIRFRPEVNEAAPGFFTTLFRALSDIPREQPIRDSLDALHALSRRTRRMRYVVEGMRPSVEAAIERSFGRTILFYRLTPGRLSRLRANAHAVAARESGFAYPAYGQLKLSGVVEGAADLLIALGRHDARPGGADLVRSAVWDHLRSLKVNEVDAPGAARAARSPYVRFLRAFDLGFRVRRLRAVIRALSELSMEAAFDSERETIEELKTEVYHLLAPFLRRTTADFYGPDVAAAAEHANADPAAALARLGEALDLSALDAATDRGLVEVLGRLAPALRRTVLLAYLGFPFYDIATLPLQQDDGRDGSEEIRVDRIAPEDCAFLRPGGDTLRGTQFSSFGAFFARSYRENDYLWGRLHAAERLIDIALSTLAEADHPPPEVADGLKHRAIAAILKQEREHLTSITPLIDALLAELAARQPHSRPQEHTGTRNASSPAIWGAGLARAPCGAHGPRSDGTPGSPPQRQ